METAMWWGLLLDVAVLVFLLISVRSIIDYLRRITLSLPTTAEQMRLINGTIRTEEAMAILEKAGGKIAIRDTRPETIKFDTSELTSPWGPAFIDLFKRRELKVIDILRARQESNR